MLTRKINYYELETRKNASANNISRWVIKKLTNVRIDTNIYKAHSCRAASSSKAKQIGISVPEILKQGCWPTNSNLKHFITNI